MTQVTSEHAMQIALGHHQAGRLAEAETLYRQVLAQVPDHAGALHLLGVLACHSGNWATAIDLIGRAIAIAPDVAGYHHNLGESYWRKGDWEAAIASSRLAIALNPGMAAAYVNLGSALSRVGRTDEAIAVYQRAIALWPDHLQAHCNLGVALHEAGRLDEACAVLRRAIALRPDDPVALTNLGSAIQAQGRLDEAVACFRKAIALDPGCWKAAGNLLFTLQLDPEYDAQALLAEHLHWGRHFGDPLAAEVRPLDIDRTPERRLRIGFVSPDFSIHPVGRILVPLFAHHDRAQAEFLAYSDVQKPDMVTEEFKTHADGWHETLGLSDAQLAGQIRADRIDILVDLAFYTGGNRMLVFARKPAPIQVSMLGMPTTTGFSTIDYRLTDPYFDPPGQNDGNYSEQSFRLPHTLWCYPPPPEAPPVGPLPALKNGFVTFGCLNQLIKVSKPAVQLWVQLLHSVPGASLIIQAPPGSHRYRLLGEFAQGGIAPDRIELVAKVPGRRAYFERYHNLDFGLDPFPYTGHLTTMDSLWMGVPVVTLAGRTGSGPRGVTILSNAGLTELIAHTPEQYVAIAVQLANDLERLSALRAGLRQRMQASPLTDGKQYAADVEAAFRRMWQTW